MNVAVAAYCTYGIVPPRQREGVIGVYLVEMAALSVRWQYTGLGLFKLVRIVQEGIAVFCVHTCVFVWMLHGVIKFMLAWHWEIHRKGAVLML